ncbi:MAG: protein kinase [Bacteroidota bacterium]
MSAFEPNQHFGNGDRYTLLEMIGVGGFSEVWKVQDNKLKGQIFALKIFAPDKGLTSSGIDQFSEEYLKTRDLDGGMFLFKPIHYEDFEGKPYLVMDYCQQGSLGTLLNKSGALSEHELAKVMYQVSTALDYLHNLSPEPIIHQDIKPDNILIKDDNYLLSDFGISSRLRKTLRKGTNSGRDFTPAYSQPERFWGKPLTSPKSDIFSFGVMIYELCTRELPWSVNGEGMGGRALLTGAAVPTLPDNLPQYLNQIVGQCMNVYPSLRPTANELKDVSKKFLDEGYWDMSLISEKVIEEEEQRILEAGSVRSTQRIDSSGYAQVSNGDLEQKISQVTQENESLRSQISQLKNTSTKKQNNPVWIVLTVLFFIMSIILFGVVTNQTKEAGVLEDRVSDLRDEVSSWRGKFSEESNRAEDLDNQIESLNAELSTAKAKIKSLEKLAPFSLLSMEIKNSSSGGTILSGSITSSSARYLKPVIRFNSNVSSGKTVNVYVKIIRPDGTMDTATSSPSGYSYKSDIYIPGSYSKNVSRNLLGWGCSSGGCFSTGTYYIEVWSEGRRLTRKSIYLR